MSIDQWKKRQANRRYQSANREKLQEYYAQKRAEAKAARPPRAKKGRDPNKRKASYRRYFERHRESILARAAQYRKAKPLVYAELPEEQRLRRIEYKRQKRREAGFKRDHNAHVKCWKVHERECRKAQRSALHDSHVKSFLSNKTVWWRWRYTHDVEFNLQQRLRSQLKKKRAPYNQLVNSMVSSALRGKGKAKRLEQIIGYTMAQLREHLELQFLPGMTWESRGKDGWHIDHILPKRCFDLSNEQGVRAYWSLSNLRPLWARDNLLKGAKIDISI